MSFILLKDWSQEIIYSEIAYKAMIRKQKIINNTLIRLLHLLTTQIAPTHINILEVNRSKAENIEGIFIPRNCVSWLGRYQSIMFEVRSKIIFYICIFWINSDTADILQRSLKKVTNISVFSLGDLLWTQVHVQQMKKTIYEGSIIVEIVYAQNHRKSNLWFPWQL